MHAILINPKCNEKAAIYEKAVLKVAYGFEKDASCILMIKIATLVLYFDFQG